MPGWAWGIIIVLIILIIIGLIGFLSWYFGTGAASRQGSQKSFSDTITQYLWTTTGHFLETNSISITQYSFKPDIDGVFTITVNTNPNATAKQAALYYHNYKPTTTKVDDKTLKFTFTGDSALSSPVTLKYISAGNLQLINANGTSKSLKLAS